MDNALNHLPRSQRIVRQAFYSLLILAFLALMGVVGHIETAGQW